MPQYKNFESLRLIAASSVIFSHSFLIADGRCAAGLEGSCVCQLDLAPFDALIWPHLVFA